MHDIRGDAETFSAPKAVLARDSTANRMDRRQRLLLPMTHPDISVSRLRQALRIEGPVPLAWLRGEA
jgi:hypothetical protein